MCGRGVENVVPYFHDGILPKEFVRVRHRYGASMLASETSPTDSQDDELRIRLYELLHDRARTERKWQFWRLAAGHLVVGVILAYAFVFERWRFIALTPVLYGIVVMDGLKYSIRLLYLQRHLVALESKLAEREPLFEWVTEYGFFGAGRRVPVEDIDLNRIPEFAQVVLIGTIYLTLIVASLLVWTPLESAATGNFPITREVLLVNYGMFSLLLGMVGYVGYVHYRRVRADIGSE